MSATNTATIATTHTNHSEEPFQSPSTHGNLTAKGIDTANALYPTSNIRTPLPHLPFPHPKWHVKPSTGEIYEVTSPLFEEYDPVTGYIGSVGEVRQSIEGGEEDIDARADGEFGAEWHGRQGMKEWNGCVSHPESCERSSIRREAKRVRDDRDGEARVGREKRIRERQ